MVAKFGFFFEPTLVVLNLMIRYKNVVLVQRVASSQFSEGLIALLPLQVGMDMPNCLVYFPKGFYHEEPLESMIVYSSVRNPYVFPLKSLRYLGKIIFQRHILALLEQKTQS